MDKIPDKLHATLKVEDGQFDVYVDTKEEENEAPSWTFQSLYFQRPFPDSESGGAIVVNMTDLLPTIMLEDLFAPLREALTTVVEDVFEPYLR